MRTSGVLMPIFSLPSNYGIGTIGKKAYRFIDFLQKAGQSAWQMLPITPTGFGDSPYQSFSVRAGNPYFIDLDMLCRDGLLHEHELTSAQWGVDDGRVDYALLYQNRFPIFKKAYARFKNNPSPGFELFCRDQSDWLDDYALFMAIKDSLNGCSLDCWPESLRLRQPQALAEKAEELKDDIGCYKMQQFLFDRQWRALKAYAVSRGIKLIGDIPIYTSADSADVWAQPCLFQLDEGLNPTAVAGCPPDAFSKDGQLWGNPLYDWQAMEKENYRWWICRIRQSLSFFDVVRIDHFRAFSAYYSIPSGNKTAVGGKWIKGPGKDFFDRVREQLGELPIIAEDLGTLDDDVHDLLKYTGFPGMKVLQFAFDPNDESSYLPHNIEKNCVVYTGTHDNDTAIGYMLDAPAEQVGYARKYLRIGEKDSFNWGMIESAMATPADTVILQMQDFLGLDNSARINVPSVMALTNWSWRIENGCTNDWLAQIIREKTDIYRRLPVTAEPAKKYTAERTEIKTAWDFIISHFFSEKTELIYDYLIETGGRADAHLPSPEQIAADYPNPCGWGTGMEDSVLSGGTAVDGMLAAFTVSGDRTYLQTAESLFRGLVRCISVSPKAGFVARSILPQDGISHYSESSRDQYTHWVYSALRMYDCALCPESTREVIRNGLRDIANRCLREVIPENNYSLLRDDGKVGMVNTLWGKLNPHEYVRLPMFYLAAYHVTGDGFWREQYLALRDEAMEKTLPYNPAKNRMYCTLQLQYSLRTVYNLDTDRVFCARVSELMHTLADFGESAVLTDSKEFLSPSPTVDFNYAYRPWDSVSLHDMGECGGRRYLNPRQSELPENRGFYILRGIGEGASVAALCPDREVDMRLPETLVRVASAVDYTRHRSYAPLMIAGGYYLCLENLLSIRGRFLD